MIHKPIHINHLGLTFFHKVCFLDFSIQINYGARIAIIGRNGSGKSSLLKILKGILLPTSGHIKIPEDVHFGYVPQVINEFESLSGGQRLNATLTQALSADPNILLLDEPTNHLDYHNRKSLMRMLASYRGTLIVVSHDLELLHNCIDTLWHIDNGKIEVFTGNYDDYIREINIKRTAILQEISRLDKETKAAHESLMKEQERSAKSRAKGKKSIKQHKWPTVVSATKVLRAEETSGRKKASIDQKKEDLKAQLTTLYLPPLIVPKFSLSAADISSRTLISIQEGSVAYQKDKSIVQDINLSVGSKDRIAIMGDNGCGKSTLIKAILEDSHVIKTGIWHVPKIQDIGYLDQHYSTLSPEKSVLETIAELVPSWSHEQLRRHLIDFLFRKNEEVNAEVKQLSGGEKARLSLAQIAAKTPRLLILDEITNNLDLETQEHVIEVIKNYPLALIVISHDKDFLKRIEVSDGYLIQNGKISLIEPS